MKKDKTDVQLPTEPNRLSMLCKRAKHFPTACNTLEKLYNILLT